MRNRVDFAESTVFIWNEVWHETRIFKTLLKFKFLLENYFVQNY